MPTIPDSGTSTDPDAPMVGHKVDKYEILSLVGQGGMGTVYEAVNTAIQKRVAIKFIDADLAKNEEANARFQREALAASAIESPHIVQIFDAGLTDDGAPYIVMELLRGEDLSSLIARAGQLELGQALTVGAQILRGLHHAHNAGIVHRDLKPDNVFLIQREDEPVAVKLLDFGVSKIARAKDVPLQTLTRQGTVVGTPHYMSPEQAQAFPDLDGRTDIFAVGAILYECLTGKRPHDGQTYEQVIVRICTQDAKDPRDLNPSVPASVSAAVLRALSRDRDDRYSSAKAFLDGLVEAAPEILRKQVLTPSSSFGRLDVRPSHPSGAGRSSPAGAVEPVSGARALTPVIVSDTPPSTPAGALADTMRPSSDPEPALRPGPESELPTVPMAAVPARAAMRKRRTVRPGWAVLIGAGLFVAAGVGTIVGVTVVGPQRTEPGGESSARQLPSERTTAAAAASSPAAVVESSAGGGTPTGAEPSSTAAESSSVEPASTAPPVAVTASSRQPAHGSPRSTATRATTAPTGKTAASTRTTKTAPPALTLQSE